VISEYEEPIEIAAASPAFAPLLRGGELVELRRHHPSNLHAFQRWYADEEIARMLRHDQRPLNDIQSRTYFTSIIMPATARDSAYAVHERQTGRLIGATALTDFQGQEQRHAFFRIVIGEKDAWGHGFGTEASRLAVLDGFERHNLDLIKLEVFRQNLRARNAYERIGFQLTGEHTEYVGRDRFPLHVLEMEIDWASFEWSNRAWLARLADMSGPPEVTANRSVTG
jgi:RimJ/RimL family protein N-acetyltransferase